jgi:hypothetical protein
MSKFQLFYPVVPFKVTQVFGVNGAFYQAHGINMKGHNGFDLMANHGQPVYASHDGIAYFETDDNQGEGVVLRTTTEYDYFSPRNPSGQAYFKTVYWHLCDEQKDPRFKCPVLIYQRTHGGAGMPVNRGDLIGYADSTGLSTGDHLHWALKPIRASTSVSPEDATDMGIGAFQNIEQLNGYLGAIDQTPYLSGKYANEVLEQLGPADRVAVIAAQNQAAGNSALAAQLWAIVAVIKAFLSRN